PHLPPRHLRPDGRDAGVVPPRVRRGVLVAGRVVHPGVLPGRRVPDAPRRLPRPGVAPAFSGDAGAAGRVRRGAPRGRGGGHAVLAAGQPAVVVVQHAGGAAAGARLPGAARVVVAHRPVGVAAAPTPGGRPDGADELPDAVGAVRAVLLR